MSLPPRTDSEGTVVGPQSSPVRLQTFLNGGGGGPCPGLSATTQHCSRSFPYITAFHLHYEIISQFKKPGC